MLESEIIDHYEVVSRAVHLGEIQHGEST